MNLSLFQSMVKTNGKLIAGFAFGSFFYLLLIIWLYPTVAGSTAMEDLLQSMPQEMLKAFGLTEGFGSIEAFIAGEYYGLLFIIILLIYSVMTSTSLVARLVDGGSMAYLLSSGLSRMKVIITQLIVLLSGLVLITLFTFISGLVGTNFLIDDVTLNTSQFLRLNIVGFLLFYTICGYCFLFSSLLNDEKKALGLSAGLSMFFYILDLASKMSEKVEWLKHFTIFSLFKPQEIVTGSIEIWGACTILLSIGSALFIAAIVLFNKRDLPL
jgi:ABC-2 type transport system permease protein